MSHRESRWHRRGQAALVGVVVGLVLLPLVLPAQGFNNSDWPPFAVGGRIIVSGHPGLLYDAGEQRRQ